MISVGSLYAAKRQGGLIRAVARLPELPNEYLLVGQFIEVAEDTLKLTRESPKRFVFAGQLPHAETLRLVGRSDILAHPSASECLPLAPLEAGQCGKAILLSDLPAHEGIWRHGVDCLMCPVGDVDLMAHSLRILATDAGLRERLGREARQTAAAFRNDLFLTRLDMVLASLA